MIELTRLNGTRFWLNSNLIEQIESAPDTTITLTTGNNILVLESLQAVIDKIISYQGQVQRESSEKRLDVVKRGA